MGRRVEIGSLRERVEVLEEPGPGGRLGRIRHANGENVPIDAQTLRWLIARAAGERDTRADRDVPADVLPA